MVGIVLLVLVLAYASAVDDHGNDKLREFWGGHPTAREQVFKADYLLTPTTVTRFGVKFGAERE